jgi:O-antigen/teichoic acid export membrane protein
MARLIRDAGFYSIGNILPKIVSFVLIPIYTRVLGPDQYGVVTALGSIEGLLLIFMSLAMERALYRVYYDYPEGERRQYLTTVALAIILSSTIIAVLLLLSGPVICPKLFSAIPFWPYYPILIGSCFFNGFTLVPAAAFMIRGQAERFVSFNIGRFVIGIASSLFFLFVIKLGALGIVLGNLVANFLFVPLSLILIFKKCMRSIFSIGMFKTTLQFSFPMLPSLLASWVINLSNRIIIDKSFSISDVGIYSLGAKIGELVIVVASAVIAAYGPIFYRIAAEEEPANARLRLRNYNTVILQIFLTIGIILSLFAKELIIILADARYFHAASIIAIVALATSINQSIALINLSIYQSKKTFQIMWITIIGAVINLILNMLLIPRIGVNGAAWATLLTAIFLFSVSYAYSRRCFVTGFNWARIYPLGIWLVIVLIIICNPSNLIGQWILFIKSLTLCLGVGLLLKLNSSEIRSLRLSKKGA